MSSAGLTVIDAAARGRQPVGAAVEYTDASPRSMLSCSFGVPPAKLSASALLFHVRSAAHPDPS